MRDQLSSSLPALNWEVALGENSKSSLFSHFALMQFPKHSCIVFLVKSTLFLITSQDSQHIEQVQTLQFRWTSVHVYYHTDVQNSINVCNISYKWSLFSFNRLILFQVNQNSFTWLESNLFKGFVSEEKYFDLNVGEIWSLLFLLVRRHFHISLQRTSS